MRQSMCIGDTAGGGGGGRTRSLSIQKNEKITRRVPILKSNSTFFFFFSTMDIKKKNMMGPRGQASGEKGRYPFRKMRKSQEQYPY